MQFADLEDYKQEVFYYKLGMEEYNSVECMTYLGWTLLNSEDIPQDVGKALFHLEKAASYNEEGSGLANYLLGRFYLNWFRTNTLNPKKAKEYFHNAYRVLEGEVAFDIHFQNFNITDYEEAIVLSQKK